jgi:trans-aconitate methyltransferase
VAPSSRIGQNGGDLESFSQGRRVMIGRRENALLGGTMTEWNAGKYEQVATLQEAMAQDALRLLDLTGREHVLDVGCGNGKITAAIATRLPQGDITGVDASRDMIAFASSHYASETDAGRHPNIRFLAADARHLPFQKEFDLVVSFNALHWIPDQDVALRSIYGAMTPNGLAQIRLVPRGERKSLENVLEETRTSAKWRGYFTDFHDPYLHLTSEEYRELAEQQGFHVVRVSHDLKAWNFQSREAFFSFGSVTFVEWTRRLPEKERPAFIHDVLDRYQAVACDKPGEENTFKFYQMDIALRPA